MDRYAICKNGPVQLYRWKLPWTVFDTETGWIYGRFCSLHAAVVFTLAMRGEVMDYLEWR